ncbi:MAG: AAA family ATPase [Flavobacteriales bacterium]|nr:AAA family ATPase [Flavobacteriales bacterium]
MKEIIGRSDEKQVLERLKLSERSEFLALHGRRRVGKTFLIREFFKNQFDFHLTGLANATTKQQLLNFDLQIKRISSKEYRASKNWIEAFFTLIDYLESIETKEKKIIFIDELPWLDTRNSDFISGLEHFWNNWADGQKNIFLIVCGSAASWMLNNVIQSKGGLHNRLTERMKIHPFNLKETAAFLAQKGCKFTPNQIVLLYMVMGGIPYYLEVVQKGMSIAQVVQHAFFNVNSPLKDEFKQLYKALFKKHEIYEKTVQILASKNKGFTRAELINSGKLSSGGTMTKVLEELEESGFITAYSSFDNKKKNINYRLSDFYTAFYFRFIAKAQQKKEENYWLNIQNQPIFNTWKGIAFEQVCLSHIKEIKSALGISGVVSNQDTWMGNVNGEKVQIDFLIDRNDQVINLVECKFSNDEFIIDKEYAANLRRKMSVFQNSTKTKKLVHLTMITSFGILKNEYYLELVQNSLETDLFF